MDRQHYNQLFENVRDTRARLPEVLRNRHSARRRRTMLGRAPRLLLVEAAPLPAGQLDLGADCRALADRAEYLYRLCLSMYAIGVDGFIGSADLIDDLLLLEVLNERVVVASMTAPLGQLPTTSFVGYDANAIVDVRLEGGYMRLPMAPWTLGDGTFDRAAQAIDILGAGHLSTLVEPCWWVGEQHAPVRDDSVDGWIRALSVLSATGARSHSLWTIVPLIDGVEEVVRSTSLPVLLRIPATQDMNDRERLLSAMRIPGVRGAVVSAAVLYPESGHPCAALEMLGRVVHLDDTGRP